MIKSVAVSVILGFLWGFAISLFNNFWTYKAFSGPKPTAVAILLFMARQAILVLSMFLVYKNLAMLIGTAMGLLAIKNYILLKGLGRLIQERKG